MYIPLGLGLVDSLSVVLRVFFYLHIICPFCFRVGFSPSRRGGTSGTSGGRRPPCSRACRSARSSSAPPVVDDRPTDHRHQYDEGDAAKQHPGGAHYIEYQLHFFVLLFCRIYRSEHHDHGERRDGDQRDRMAAALSLGTGTAPIV